MQEQNPIADEPKIVAATAPLVIREVMAHPRNYAASRSKRTILFLVLHCTEGHEGTTQDANVAHMFQDPALDPKRTCHYVADTDSITRCVRDNDIAYQAGHTGNARGLGLELCGLARQSRADWLDALSLPTLGLAARWAADKCREHNLPVRFLDAAALRKGATGITTHREVALAWHETNHTDPGPSFPMDLFIHAVQQAYTLTH
jgi:hypothetical protein